MNDLKPIVVPLACALGLTLFFTGCREDLGCPVGTVLVDGVCESAPDMGSLGPDACTLTNFYPDADEDGAGAGEPVSACSAPEGYADNDDDCDDTCAVCNTGDEVCDGEDNDCDGEVDEDIAVVCGTNEGECSTGTQLCVGGVLGACEGGVAPAIAEVCEGSKDENCDGEVDEDCDCAVGTTRPCGTDTGECSMGTQTCTAAGVFGDCEDAVGPAPETCNGLDDNCDGVEDDGNPGGGAVCGTDTGECVAGVLMCVDGDVVCTGSTGPQPETCNGLDDDCSGVNDEGVQTTYYRDQDGDNRGAPGMTRQACALPNGYVTNANDCNDMCNVCWTGASETCDGLDNNCTGGTDEGVTTRFFEDADDDARGNPDVFMDACGLPDGYVVNQNDCDDACGLCWTNNAEACDGADNDCSGASDDVFPCVQGESVPCTTSCGTTGTGSCTAMCGIPAAAACNPPNESCNAVDDDCDGFTDEGVQTFGTSTTGPLGNAAKLASDGSGFVGVLRYNGVARVYRINASGTVTHSAANVDDSDVLSVDIARISDTQWVTASALEGDGVNVRLIGLSSGAPTSQDVELVNESGTSGLARVAANSASDAMTVYQSGSTIRVGHVDFTGALASSVALPGSNPRAELGMDIAARGAGNGYVVTWVTGVTPTVNVAFVSAGLSVTSSGTVGMGSNPTVAVTPYGVGVAYAGTDNRPRLHYLSPSLNCLNGTTRTMCPVTTSTRTVATPMAASTFHSTLDLETTTNGHLWLVARTSDGELVQRLATEVREEVFRTSASTAWISVAVGSTGAPLISRGSGTVYTHNLLGCPAP